MPIYDRRQSDLKEEEDGANADAGATSVGSAEGLMAGLRVSDHLSKENTPCIDISEYEKKRREEEEEYDSGC